MKPARGYPCRDEDEQGDEFIPANGWRGGGNDVHKGPSFVFRYSIAQPIPPDASMIDGITIGK